MRTYMETPFSGLIPAKLVSRHTDERTQAQMVKLKLTANRRAYKRGEVIETFARDFVQVTSRRGGRIWVKTVSE